MGSYVDLENGETFDANSFNDKFGIYGPHVPQSKILIEEAYGISGGSGAISPKENDFIELFDGKIEESGVRQFTSSNPMPPQITDEELIVYTQKIEKRIYNTFSINIDKGEVFNPSSIFIGCMNMDETICGDEILEHFIFVPKKNLKGYVEEYLLDNDWNNGISDAPNTDEELYEYIDEIFHNEHPVADKIIKKHSISSISCEGKGEWENDYVKIVDSSDEILFEDGSY